MKDRITSVMNEVLVSLRNCPSARDNDELLYCNIIGGKLNHDYASDPNRIKFESVTRARRKCQQEHPELRGSTYVNRHKEAEKIRKAS